MACKIFSGAPGLSGFREARGLAATEPGAVLGGALVFFGARFALACLAQIYDVTSHDSRP